MDIRGKVAIDTGAADSSLFGRRSVVGLEGAFGLVTVGREYSPIAAVAAMSDILIWLIEVADCLSPGLSNVVAATDTMNPPMKKPINPYSSGFVCIIISLLSR